MLGHSGLSVVPVNPLGIANMTSTDTVGTSVVLTVNTNGTLTMYNTGLDATVTYNYYTPTTTGEGAGFWVRYTVLSVSPTSGSPTGSWLQCNNIRSWTVSRSALGITTCTFQLDFATDSAGINIVATDTSTAMAARVISE